MLRFSDTEQVAAIIDSSTDAIVSQDLGGLVVTWNRAAERLYGFGREEMVGQPAAVLAAPARADHQADVIARVFEGERVEHYETLQRRRDGSPLEVSITASPIRDASGAITGVSTSARDISERKHVERELDRLRRAVERRNGELERSNADLYQFASLASHDLSEPLRAITGYLELLLRRCDGDLDATSARYVHEAIDGAGRMRGLIDDLLAYAQMDRARQPHVQSVDCTALVRQALRELGPAIEECGARVTWEALPEVPGRRSQLGQVFQNLLANAVKFRDPQRAPEIVVRAERDETSWRFSVADNGIGIDPRHAERIFQPFKRLHARDAYPGTGIGLAVVRKVVDRHGGRVWAEPNPTDGTTVTFTLPASRGGAT